jgi:hypothetical protein
VIAISDETTWKPAMKDGKAIASVLKIPATMTLPVHKIQSAIFSAF